MIQLNPLVIFNSLFSLVFLFLTFLKLKTDGRNVGLNLTGRKMIILLGNGTTHLANGMEILMTKVPF